MYIIYNIYKNLYKGGNVRNGMVMQVQGISVGMRGIKVEMT